MAGQRSYSVAGIADNIRFDFPPDSCKQLAPSMTRTRAGHGAKAFIGQSLGHYTLTSLQRQLSSSPRQPCPRFLHVRGRHLSC